MATEKRNNPKNAAKKLTENNAGNTNENASAPKKKAAVKKTQKNPEENTPKENTVNPAEEKKEIKKAGKISNTKEEAITFPETKPVKAAAKKTTTKKASEDAEKVAKKAAKSPAKKSVKPKATLAAESSEEEKITPQTETVATVKSSVSKITFQLRFHTNFGQQLFITGDDVLLGNNDIDKALPMQYLDSETWIAELTVDADQIAGNEIIYNYVLKFEDGTLNFDWGRDKTLNFSSYNKPEVLIIDSWNHAGFYENAFYTEPFKDVLLKNNYTAVDIAEPSSFTHIFKVKAPLLNKGEVVCLAGNADVFGNWQTEQPILLNRKENEDYWTAKFDLSNILVPLAYKYGVYDINQKKFVRFESGKNRSLNAAAKENVETIVNDGFIVLPDNTWKGAGVAIPVFSLKSEKSFGTGEFTDIKLLIDWAKKTGLKLVQLLPVNDTTATHTWTDSYPYAAISAFALHPMYLNMDKLLKDENKHLLDEYRDEQQRLNDLDTLDYEAVNNIKWEIIKKIYPLQKEEVFRSDDYKQFYVSNKHWLVPYIAFCFLRDKYHTSDFDRWPDYKNYNENEIDALINDEKNADAIGIFTFIQYHLHLQLKEATEYAHQNSIIVKGDIPIGIYRYGVDAWQNPDLYCMDMQAGAPPDPFAEKGQNWGFPTYNWNRMKENGFTWWKQRFEQMSLYFDAFRIDHILGFFRIWSIPVDSVEGIMGHFEPAVPVHIHEFHERNIWFDYERYCKPYITDQILNDNFGDQQDVVKQTFLIAQDNGTYHLKPEFGTQRLLENYFNTQEDNAHNRWLKQALFDLISNVILFEEKGTNGQQFHFRFGMEKTESFKYLDAHTQNQLRDLYINYFFRRQDGFWKDKALQKLPALKRVTNMLICGEDLGMVPASVPDVMKQLGLLSLEVQRMPKNPKKEFFHPNDAPYLSVVTPSTHDMSTIRGWWEEDRNLIQDFYNRELGYNDQAPFFCEAWINEAIIIQHLYSPAMWAIFQLQDLLGMSKELRRPNPHDERINVPAITPYYWRYRIHLTLEDLLIADEFNEKLKGFVEASKR